jgi:hypothetical protein
MSEILNELRAIREKQSEIQIESMATKLEIQNTVHSIDKRLVKMETNWKMAIPLVGMVFGIVGSFIKAKIFGMKG